MQPYLGYRMDAMRQERATRRHEYNADDNGGSYIRKCPDGIMALEWSRHKQG